LGQHPTSKFISTHPVFYSTKKPSLITFSDRDYFIEEKPVRIGSDVWIGTNAIIMDGVIVQDGAIIAANAVVTRNVPAYAIVAGVPARIIKYRFKPSQIRKIKQSKWWERETTFLAKNFRAFHHFKSFVKLFKQL